VFTTGPPGQLGHASGTILGPGRHRRRSTPATTPRSPRRLPLPVRGPSSGLFSPQPARPPRGGGSKAAGCRRRRDPGGGGWGVLDGGRTSRRCQGGFAELAEQFSAPRAEWSMRPTRARRARARRGGRERPELLGVEDRVGLRDGRPFSKVASPSLWARCVDPRGRARRDRVPARPVASVHGSPRPGSPPRSRGALAAVPDLPLRGGAGSLFAKVLDKRGLPAPRSQRARACQVVEPTRLSDGTEVGDTGRAG